MTTEGERAEDLEAIAAEVQAGRDSLVVPEELVEEPEERAPVSQNLRARIFDMSVGERIKLALKGNRDARTILLRDSNRLIQKFVLQNPRISDEEIIALAKNRSIDREFLELIGKKKEWLSNYQVKLALVTNPKTPLAIAVRLVPTLLLRDLRALAKSKNVPSVVNGIAKRLVIERTGSV